jgi:hypothetical protein
MLRSTLLVLTLASTVVGATLPGYRSQDLGRLEIEPSDLRTLAAALSLDGDDAQAAHAAMNTYRDAITEGSKTARTEIGKHLVKGAAELARSVSARRAMVNSIRDSIDARRRAGDFTGDPDAMREAFEEAMADAEREIAETREAGARLPGWGEAFTTQAQLIEAWYAVSDAQLQVLRAALGEVAGENRQAAFEKWWLDTTVDHGIVRGRLAGERLDPDAPLEELGLRKGPGLAIVRMQWRADHAKLLAARDAALRSLPLDAANAIERGKIDLWRRAVERSLTAREAVRDHAWSGVQERSLFLGDADEAVAYRDAAIKLGYPAVGRRDRAMRILRAALARTDLDESQRAMVLALQLEHRALSREIQEHHLAAVLADEGQLLADQDVARVSVFFPGQKFNARGTPQLAASSAERKKFTSDTLTQLQSVMTETQWLQLPGTRTQPVRD